MSTVNIKFSSDQVVHCFVDILRRAAPFDFSVVYGLHTISHRKELWRQLQICGVTTPWLVGGDFNTIFFM